MWSSFFPTGELASQGGARTYPTYDKYKGTGLLWSGYRFYNPNTGRWLSRDPIGEYGGTNIYSFSLNSPPNIVDRLGLDPVSFQHFDNGLKYAFSFRGKLDVDVDGSPYAYHPNGSPPGLDSLASATSNGQLSPNVLVFKDGQPYIQPNGFYLAKTSLQDPTKSIFDPSRYVDPYGVPYLVLPRRDGDLSDPNRRNRNYDRSKAQLGDLGMIVYWPLGSKNCLCDARRTPTIFADYGPRRGEASTGAAAGLGVAATPNDSPLHNIHDRVLYIVFPGSNGLAVWPYSTAQIPAQAEQLFQAWGGMKRACRELEGQ